MRNRKKWGALVLAVITIAALTLSGCRKEREKINPDDLEPNTVQVSTESEPESETKTTEKNTEKTTEKTSESETKTSESNSTPQSESNTTGNTTPNTTGNGTSTGGTTGGTTTGTTGGTTNNGGTTGGEDNNGTTGGDNGDGDAETVTTEAPRYFFDANGSRVDVSQLPDGSWQDENGTSYTFYENGVKDSNGNQYYYDPPSNGNTSVEVGSSADFYDTQGNHIVCTMDENGNWVDSEGNIYIFGEDGVTDSNGNFHPY